MTGPNYACLPAWQNVCSSALGCRVLSDELRAPGGGPLLLFRCAVLRSRIFGTRLISLPFSDESALELRDPRRAGEAGRLLLARLDELAAWTGATSAELRGFSPVLESLGAELSRSEPYVRFVLDLSGGYAAAAARYHPNIAKNLSQGGRRLRVRALSRPDAAELRRLYLVYLSQMRRFGSPPLPMSYFSAMSEAGLYVFFEALLDGRTAGMLAAIPDGAALRSDVNASLPFAAKAFPKVRLFDESIRWACAAGFSSYDMMRTRRGTGVYLHKAKWGGEERPVTYYYRAYFPSARREPDPMGAPYRLASLGLRLLPLALLEKIGPAIRAGAGK